MRVKAFKELKELKPGLLGRYKSPIAKKIANLAKGFVGYSVSKELTIKEQYELAVILFAERNEDLSTEDLPVVAALKIALWGYDAKFHYEALKILVLNKLVEEKYWIAVKDKNKKIVKVVKALACLPIALHTKEVLDLVQSESHGIAHIKNSLLTIFGIIKNIFVSTSECMRYLSGINDPTLLLAPLVLLENAGQAYCTRENINLIKQDIKNASSLVLMLVMLHNLQISYDPKALLNSKLVKILEIIISNDETRAKLQENYEVLKSSSNDEIIYQNLALLHRHHLVTQDYFNQILVGSLTTRDIKRLTKPKFERSFSASWSVIGEVNKRETNKFTSSAPVFNMRYFDS